ncbi:MAG: HNH endonuclease [Acidimicrobiales bacterium]|nr:HNH endonuclease [Acidimicrobiales bacterium]
MTRRRDLTGDAYRKRRALAIANSGGICCLCGEPMRLDLPGTHPLGPTAEHLIPVARGGHPTDPRNLSASHQRCNSARQDRLLSEMRMAERPSRTW